MTQRNSKGGQADVLLALSAAWGKGPPENGAKLVNLRMRAGRILQDQNH